MRLMHINLCTKIDAQNKSRVTILVNFDYLSFLKLSTRSMYYDLTTYNFIQTGFY